MLTFFELNYLNNLRYMIPNEQNQPQMLTAQ